MSSSESADWLSDDERAEIERRLPAYRVEEPLGQGGVGMVVAATHLRLGRRVAIKRLPATFAADPNVRRRFVAEARILAGLNHPHIVRVHDFVEDDGLCLLVMELLSGGTLEDRHERSELHRAEACAVALATCAALAYAQKRQVLHRDIKPSNLMFDAEGVVRVVDFGIAKVLGGQDSLATAAGTVLGTPAYMAPEQVTGSLPTPATDVYAVATFLYRLLAGRLPFEPEPGLDLLVARVRQTPVALRELADVPDQLGDVVMRGLCREPAERYEDGQSFGIALADAATAGMGSGWLTGSMTPVFATGALFRAVSRAGGMAAAPASTVLLPPPSNDLRTTVLDAAAIAQLRPVREVVADDSEPDAAERTTAPDHPDGRTVELREGMPFSPATPAMPEPVTRQVIVELREPRRHPRQVRLQETSAFGRKCEGIVLADPDVSRRHFELELDETGVWLHDLGSTNGTYLNGVAVTGRTSVRPGSVIEAGDSSVLVLAVQ